MSTVNKKATKAKVPTTPWNAIKVTVPDGHTWIVGRCKVEDDYAAFLMEADGLTLGHATESVRSSEIDFWFHDQYILSEVVRDGTIINRPSYERLIDPDYSRVNELHECAIEFITL